jgi:hypothetical protein
MSKKLTNLKSYLSPTNGVNKVGPANNAPALSLSPNLKLFIMGAITIGSLAILAGAVVIIIYATGRSLDYRTTHHQELYV